MRFHQHGSRLHLPHITSLAVFFCLESTASKQANVVMLSVVTSTRIHCLCMQDGVSESEDQSRDRKDTRNIAVPGRRDCADIVQGCSLEQRRIASIDGTGAAAVVAGRHGQHLKEMAEGIRCAACWFFLLVRLVPSPVQGRQEVSGSLFLHCAGLLPQLPASGCHELGRREEPLRVAVAEEDGDRHCTVCELLCLSSCWLFQGSMGSGIGFLVMSWCVEQRGPVFTAAFTPLVQIIVAGIDFAVLHEQIYLGRYPHAAVCHLPGFAINSTDAFYIAGSVLGSGLVIAGLYSLLWGKNKEPGSCAAKPAEGNGENQVQQQLQTA
ncbi:hypothetical protein GW17_00012830 [Ensete ventricosum]|nr:hypothetical protein GW17_00012830 [Ensete ventricosum]